MRSIPRGGCRIEGHEEYAVNPPPLNFILLKLIATQSHAVCRPEGGGHSHCMLRWLRPQGRRRAALRSRRSTRTRRWWLLFVSDASLVPLCGIGVNQLPSTRNSCEFPRRFAVHHWQSDEGGAPWSDGAGSAKLPEAMTAKPQRTVAGNDSGGGNDSLFDSLFSLQFSPKRTRMVLKMKFMTRKRETPRDMLVAFTGILLSAHIWADLEPKKTRVR